MNLYLHFLLQIVSANFKNYFHHPSGYSGVPTYLPPKDVTSSIEGVHIACDQC